MGMLSAMFADARRRLVSGGGSPVKNQVVWVSPQDVSVMIDSENAGFQRAVLGHDFERTPETKRARLSRTALRVLDDVITATDFDLYVQPLERDATLKRLQQKYAMDLTFEQAGFHDWMMEEIRKRGSLDGCRSRADVEARYEALECLTNDLRSGGRISVPANCFSRYGGADGIFIAVGREGKLIFTGRGKHRLGIARGLKIASLPVCVTAVHADCLDNGAWLNILERSQRLRAP